MASLVANPPSPNVGQEVSFVGSGFLPATLCKLSIIEEGYKTEVKSDAAGYFGTTDVADHAVTLLTSSGVNVTADDTVTIGAVTYTFKANPTGIANAVKIGSDADVTLANLAAAINHTGTNNVEYGAGTVAHPTVLAGTHDATAHTLELQARTGGTAGNALASTTTAVTYSFPGATFNAGTPGSASTGEYTMIWTPTKPGTFHVEATDDTNTAKCVVRVWE